VVLTVLERHSYLWAAAAAALVLSVLFAGTLLLRLPSSYLVEVPAVAAPSAALKRSVLRAAKNVAGVIVVAIGAVLAIPGVPGPGIPLIVAGLLLLDIPGKRKLELRLLGRPSVLRTVNGFRARFRKPPIVAAEHPPSKR
jgi:hypothetical protein